MNGLGAVVSPTMSWDLSAAALLSLVGMISTPKLSPYSFAMPSALATSMSQRYMVLIWGSASCTAEIIVRPITPAPTRHAVSASEGAAYLAIRSFLWSVVGLAAPVAILVGSPMASTLTT